MRHRYNFTAIMDAKDEICGAARKMTSQEMQRLSAQKRWGKMTPKQRSEVMSRVRAGEKAKKGQNPREGQ